MNAHSFAIMNLCMACGFAIIDTMNIFSTSVEGRTGFFSDFLTLWTNPIFTVPGTDIPVTGIALLAGALAACTIVVLNSNFITEKGAAMIVYTAVFYTSLFIVGVEIFNNFDYPGMTLFYNIYLLFGSLAFIYMLTQLSAGSGKAID